MAGDVNFASVSLLLHFDGANGSSSFADASSYAHTVTPVGGASISTAQSIFGGAAGDFTAAGSYLDIPASPAFSFPGDFTLEWGSLRPSVTGDAIAMHTTTNASATDGWWVNFSGDSLVVYNKGALIISVASAGVADGVFRRWAISRVGTALSVLRDGSVIGSTTTSADFSSSNNLQIGGHSSFGSYSPWIYGYLDELRITKGIGRYTGNYTLDSEPFGGAIALALSGLVKNAADAPAARLVRALREDTGVAVGYATSDASTGAYSIPTTHEGAHTLIAYPAAGENLPALTLRGVIPV